ERGTKDTTGDVPWRSTSRDNVLTVYGADAAARIADPTDPTRGFSWLISEVRDDRGQAVLYSYQAEDAAGVDLTQAHERNRGPADSALRCANSYLKRIRYGNEQPLLDAAGRRPRFLSEADVANTRWMFEVVLDYGDHDTEMPLPDEPQRTWTCRPDPFSSYRAAFEVRTYRLCRRVMMSPHFEAEPQVGKNCLVRSTRFEYTNAAGMPQQPAAGYTLLTAVTHTSHRRSGAGYRSRSLP